MKPSHELKSNKRLASIDALRGFDMLMIAGLGSVIASLGCKTDSTVLNTLAAQFEHPVWNGFTFYDFIFPLFLFIAGISLPFSIQKSRNLGHSHKEIIRKSLKRMIILILLGILYKNAPLPFTEWSQIRLGSVLGRIGIAGFSATIIYLYFPSKQRIFWVAGILIAYFAALMFIPVPGFGAGDLSFEGNLVGWFDRTFLPGRLLQGTFDELGLLTQLPAICLTILGSQAGMILKDQSVTEMKKLTNLVLWGTAVLVIGILWSFFFPINKHLWTSSFILLTSGMAFLTLALFYWAIDICNNQKWALFFKVIGLNSLTIYLIYRFVNFQYSSRLLFEGFYEIFDEKWHDFFQSVGALFLVWVFLYFLYKKKIFLKV